MVKSDSCRICGEDTVRLFSGELLHYSVEYMECSKCGFVQTEKPYWLAEAYKNTINLSDTGILVRNSENLAIVISALFSLNGLRNEVADFAGGYGLLVRMLRDAGIEAWHSDPYCKNLVAAGFEHDGSEVFLVTAFEAFEHFLDPLAELERMFKTAPNILLSTTLIPDPAPSPDSWWYYGKEHGQHISFYRKQTFEYLAQKYSKHFVSDGRRFHLFSEKPIGESHWRILLRGRMLLKLAASFVLRSKTLSDHQAKIDQVNHEVNVP